MHLTDEQINDLADGTLTGAARASALEHMQVCEQCNREVAAVRSLLQHLNQLPAEIAPARDLRAGMWAQADRRTLWSWRYQLAAAAVILIAISSVVTATLLNRSSEPALVVLETTGGSPVDFVSLERQYRAEAADLQDALDTARAQLAPETVRILEENLHIIDTAIQEARAALARDPHSATLGELWRSAHQRKLDLLKQAARSSAAT